MPIQPHFDLDIINTISQVPQKLSVSPASLMDFVFKEFIYQENTAQSTASHPSQSARSQETQAESENTKEEGAFEGEEVPLVALCATPPDPVRKASLSFERVEPSFEQAFTMKQLDQMLGDALQSEDLEPDITHSPLPSSPVEREPRFFSEVKLGIPPLAKPLPLQNEGKDGENTSLAPQEEKDFFSSFEIEKTGRLEESSVRQEQASQEMSPVLSEETGEHITRPPSSFEMHLTPETPSLPPPLSLGHEEASPPVTPPASPEITPQVLDQLPRSLFSVQGNHHIKIQLYPEELGEVTITLKIGDKKQIQAIFSAASGGTLDLLRQEAPQLLHALKKEGFDVASEHFQFNAQQDNPQDPSRQKAFPSQPPLIQDEISGPPQDMFERRAFSSKRLENNLVDIRVY